MNNKEILELNKFRYSRLAEKIKDDKDLNILIIDLLCHLEDYVKREEELFNIENHILWIDYRDYKFKIYLDAERNTLVGDLLLNDEINVIGLESDSIVHLITEMERAVDNQINYKYQSQLAEENIKLRDWAKLYNCEYPFNFGESSSNPQTILPQNYFKEEQTQKLLKDY